MIILTKGKRSHTHIGKQWPRGRVGGRADGRMHGRAGGRWNAVPFWKAVPFFGMCFQCVFTAKTASRASMLKAGFP